jgi:hypothetical protein
VKGEIGGDLLGSEGTGVFFFIHQFDSSHPHITVIEIKVLGVVDGVSDLDSVSDIGRGYLIEATFEADGGIVIDHAFIADEEYLIQLRLGESSDGHCVDGRTVAIHRSFSDASMQLVVVVLLEPQPEGLVEFFEADTLLDPGKETITDSSKKAFNFPAGGAVVWLGVGKGYPGQGTAA